jgi:uncharacterized protein YbjT (DUF2867 family)
VSAPKYTQAEIAAEIIEAALRDAFVVPAPLGGQLGVVEMIQPVARAQDNIAAASRERTRFLREKAESDSAEGK